MPDHCHAREHGAQGEEAALPLLPGPLQNGVRHAGGAEAQRPRCALQSEPAVHGRSLRLGCACARYIDKAHQGSDHRRTDRERADPGVGAIAGTTPYTPAPSEHIGDSPSREDLRENVAWKGKPGAHEIISVHRLVELPTRPWDDMFSMALDRRRAPARAHDHLHVTTAWQASSVQHRDGVRSRQRQPQ